jgi:hypothetical protein
MIGRSIVLYIVGGKRLRNGCLSLAKTVGRERKAA